MSACEKCWGDAFSRSYGSGRSQAECYTEILKERENNPCSPREQAGQYWDKEHGCDSRLLNKDGVQTQPTTAAASNAGR